VQVTVAFGLPYANPTVSVEESRASPWKPSGGHGSFVPLGEPFESGEGSSGHGTSRKGEPPPLTAAY
jgi:hypothetical protein